MTADPGAAGSSATRAWGFWLTALVILVLDLWTKHLVFNDVMGVDPGKYATIQEFWHDARRPPVPLIGTQVRLVTMLNPGMMWGAFDKYPQVLKIVRPLAVLVIFFLLKSLPSKQWTARLALGGILGGALGNIYDSLRYPGVRDFLEVDFDFPPVFDPFPAFNLADSAICVGVALLALGMLAGKKTPETGP